MSQLDENAVIGTWEHQNDGIPAEQIAGARQAVKELEDAIAQLKADLGHVAELAKNLGNRIRCMEER